MGSKVEELSDKDLREIAMADYLSADEIVSRGIHFTNPTAKIISINKVAKAGAKQCEDLLAKLNEPEPKKKAWWKFW